MAKKKKSPMKGKSAKEIENADLTQFGGKLVVPYGAKPKDIAPEERQYNFGVRGRPGLGSPDDIVHDSMPTLYSVAPRMEGAWDGKSMICCHEAARKVLGKDLPAQMQPRGTCGGRTAKRAGQLLQCVMIALGGRIAKFRDVSHAWPYAIARAEYGMTGSGENDDGVAEGSIPPVLAKYGFLTAEEAKDTNYYGAGSDDQAVRLGARRSNIPQEFWTNASDNRVEANLVKVRTFQEYMDGIVSGGVGLVASARGFTMTRDKYGVCAPRGTWYHYMTLSGGGVAKNGQRVAAIDQSWGSNTPGGPTIEDGRWPDYSFLGDADVVERDMIRAGAVHVIFGFPLWDEEVKINWRKI